MFKMVVKLEAGVMIGLGPTKNKLAPRPFWGVFHFFSLFFLGAVSKAFQLLDIFSHYESSTVSV